MIARAHMAVTVAETGHRISGLARGGQAGGQSGRRHTRGHDCYMNYAADES